MKKERKAKFEAKGSITIEAALIFAIMICAFIEGIYLSAESVMKIKAAGQAVIAEYSQDMEERSIPQWLRKTYALHTAFDMEK